MKQRNRSKEEGLCRCPDYADVGIIIERDGEVCVEAQHVVLARAQPVQQSPRLGLRDAATGFRVDPGRGLNITCREDLPVSLPERLECFFAKAGVPAGFRRLNLPMRADQEIGHLFRPPQLGSVFTDFLQLSEMAGLLKLSLLGGFEEFFEFLSSQERNVAFSCSRRSTRFSSVGGQEKMPIGGQ